MASESSRQITLGPFQDGWEQTLPFLLKTTAAHSHIQHPQTGMAQFYSLTLSNCQVTKFVSVLWILDYVTEFHSSISLEVLLIFDGKIT